MIDRSTDVRAALKSRQRGFFTMPGGMGAGRPAGGSGPSDPDFSSVGLLAHFDGTNGATTTVDSSGIPKTITVVNSSLQTASKQFGSASLLIPFVNNCGVTSPNHSDWNFATGMFTIECWHKPSELSSNTNRGLICHDSIGATRGWLLLLENNDSGGVLGRPNFGAWSGATVAALVSSSGAISTSVFTHIAITRDASGVFRMFVGGVLSATNNSNTSLSIGNPSVPLAIGCLYGTSGFLGNSSAIGGIDDVRITKGVCRYTSTFTPPNAPFPNF